MAVTPADVRLHLESFGITEAQMSDAWIDKTRDTFVIPYIEKVIHRSLTSAEPAEHTEIIDSYGDNMIVLRRRPILADPKPTIRYIYPADYAEVSESFGLGVAEVLESEGSLRLFHQPKGDYNLKVTYSVPTAVGDVTLERVITLFLSEKVLGAIASRTGGGQLSTSGYSRNFGERGKYTEYRDELTREAISLLQPYMSL